MQTYKLFADQYEGNATPDFISYAKAGHCLYAHKATEGTRHVDARHVQRTQRAHQEGLTVMHYHFCRPDQHDPHAEAAHFWRAVKPVLETGDWIALDFEKEGSIPRDLYTPDYIEALYNGIVRLSGEQARVYGSTSFLQECTRRRWLRRRARWQAQWGSRPGWAPWGTPWWAWQRTDGQQGPDPHSLAGIGPCDISELNRWTAAALRLRTWRRRRRIKD